MGAIAVLGTMLAFQAAVEDPRALVLRSAIVDAGNRALQRNYTYRERVVERQFDGSGKTKSTEAKTFDVLNLYGRPYRRLIEKDGRPLAARQDSEEQSKIDREMAKRSRESESDRRKHREKEDKELKEEQAFRREIADAFQFTTLPAESIGGMPCHVIEAWPEPGFKPRTRDGQALSKMKGRLWISRDGLRWVKVETETIDTISLGWFLLRVAKGTRFLMEAGRVGGEVWMPSHFHVRGDARVAGLKRFNMEVDVAWSEFRKFTTESRVVPSTEP